MAVDRIRELAIDKEVNINIVDKDGRTPLLWLCYFNQNDRVYQAIKSLLLRKAVDINHKDNLGLNALCCVSYRGVNLFHVFKVLLLHGIDINSTSHDGRNGLFCLFKDFVPNLLSIVKMLIEEGISVKATSNDGSTTLIALTKSHHSHSDYIELARLLILHHVSLNATNDKGQSALSILCEQHRLSDSVGFALKIQELMKAGADITAKINGRSAFDIIKKRCKNCPEKSPLLLFDFPNS